MSIPSNYTNQEALKLFGPIAMATSDPERIEGLVDLEAQVEAISADQLRTAIAQYPAEDFTEGVLAMVLDLENVTVGELKGRIDDIAEVLAALEGVCVNASEYGIEQLEGLAQDLEAAGVQ